MNRENLQTWIIEPHDSLIARDGKPFGGSITHAFSLDFPFPSTTTGGVRTRAGSNQDGVFEVPKDSEEKKNKLSGLKNIEVRGSLLAEIDDEGEIKRNGFYLPAPADALFLQSNEQKNMKNPQAQIYRLLPLNFPDALNNLKDSMPVGLNRTDKKDKPYSDLKFWNWKTLKEWLRVGKDSDSVLIKDYGIGNLQKDTRTHVAINEFFASEEGNLFQTRGLEFNYGDGNLQARKFGLAVFVDEANSKKLRDKGKLAPLGGERRLVRWRESEETHSILRCPNEIKERIVEEKHCRLMFLTPAYFENGLPQNVAGCEIKAIACNRYQTVSGWDFEKNKPKPTRRLVPAGSILFLELKGDEKQRNDWVEKTWFSCISDTDAKSGQDFSKDGFGLSILGTWDGEPLNKWE